MLTNITNASGLSKAHKDELEALLHVHTSVSARNKRLLDYYESENITDNIGIETIPETVNVRECCAWPKKAVTSVSERSRFDGFVFESGESYQALNKVVRDNGLTGAYNRHAPSELIHGCMFATVGRNGKNTITRFHTAETSAATWDSALGRIASGFVIADKKRMPWSNLDPVPVQVNMHLPGEIVVLTRTGASSWRAESLRTPLDRPMMEAFAYRATGIKPFGESRISKTVMSITNDVIRTLQNMAVSGTFYAAPQKYLLGLTDEQYDSMVKDKFSAYIGSMLLSTRDEDGKTPEFGQLSPSSPQPYIDMLRTYATMFSGATGVPVSSLGIVQDNPSSAQAIESSREDICIAAEDLNHASADSLRNVALMAMAVEENKRIEDLTDDQQSVMAIFKDPAMPSIVSQADAAVKTTSADPGFGGTDVFYEMLGFDKATIARIKSDKRKMQASNTLSQLLGE